jgi:hydrogenase maturation protease
MRIVLIGIGQSLRGDDGAGPASVQYWEKHYSKKFTGPPIQVVYADTPGLAILDFLVDADIAVFADSIQSGKSPGTITILDPVPVVHATTSSAKSAHGIGLLETLAIAHHSGQPLPSRLILVGIEAVQFEMGKGIDPSVQTAIPKAAKAIQESLVRLIPDSIVK